VTSSLESDDFGKFSGEHSRHMEQLEAARGALQLSPEELKELEKTDLLLARTLMCPGPRAMIEGLFSLPAESLEELASTSTVLIDYEEAPQPLKEACRVFSRYGADIGDLHRPGPWEPIRFDVERPEKEWPEAPFEASIRYQLKPEGFTFMLLVQDLVPTSSGPQPGFIASCPPMSNVETTARWDEWARLLAATGTPDGDAVWKLLSEWGSRRELEEKEEEERRRAEEWAEPVDPDLQRTILLQPESHEAFPEVQRMIAQETGLSVVSDYFTLFAYYVPDEGREELPLWRLLYVLSERWGYRWKKVGECLVFHHAQWYDMVRREIPEHVLAAYREKLRERGQFTLEEAAALAALMARAPDVNVPDDLREAGLLPIGYIFSFFEIPMSAEQFEKARSAEGLSFEEMTEAQRQKALEILEEWGGESALQEQYGQGRLLIRESAYEPQEGRGTEVELQLRFRISAEKERTYAESHTLRYCGEEEG
jgi:hypothetical protein